MAFLLHARLTPIFSSYFAAFLLDASLAFFLFLARLTAIFLSFFFFLPASLQAASLAFYLTRCCKLLQVASLRVPTNFKPLLPELSVPACPTAVETVGAGLCAYFLAYFCRAAESEFSGAEC